MCFYLVASAPLKEAAIIFKLSGTHLRGIFFLSLLSNYQRIWHIKIIILYFPIRPNPQYLNFLNIYSLLRVFFLELCKSFWLTAAPPNPVFLIAQCAQEAFLTCQHDFYCSCTMKKKRSHWLIPLPWGAGLTSIPLEIPTWIPMNAKIFKDTGICSVKTEIMHITYRCRGTVGVVEASFQKGSTETIL